VEYPLPFHIDIKMKQIVKILVDHGVNIHIKIIKKNQTLTVAIHHWHDNIIKLLIDHIDDYNQKKKKKKKKKRLLQQPIIN